MLPQDPIILLSTVNTRLRDFHKSLDDFCLTENISKDSLIETLAKVNYHYDSVHNQFK
jgi:hypothetical protein